MVGEAVDLIESGKGRKSGLAAAIDTTVYGVRLRGDLDDAIA